MRKRPDLGPIPNEEAIFVQHQGLIRAVLKRFPNGDREELEAIARVSLLRAIRTFRPGAGRFSSYAWLVMSRDLIDHVRRCAHLITPIGRDYRNAGLIDRARERVFRRRGVPPTVEEVARETGLSVRDVERSDEYIRSACHPSMGGDGVELEAPLVSPEERAVLSDAVERAMSALGDRERDALVRVSMMDQTYEEAGKAMGISASRVYQYHKRARSKAAPVLREAGYG